MQIKASQKLYKAYAFGLPPDFKKTGLVISVDYESLEGAVVKSPDGRYFLFAGGQCQKDITETMCEYYRLKQKGLRIQFQAEGIGRR